MTRANTTLRLVALALAVALASACLVAPALVAAAGQAWAPATVSHPTSALGFGHALRADGAGPAQRGVLLAGLAFALAIELARAAGAVVAPAHAAAPGSFERPLRI